MLCLLSKSSALYDQTGFIDQKQREKMRGGRRGGRRRGREEGKDREGRGKEREKNREKGREEETERGRGKERERNDLLGRNYLQINSSRTSRTNKLIASGMSSCSLMKVMRAILGRNGGALLSVLGQASANNSIYGLMKSVKTPMWEIT